MFNFLKVQYQLGKLTNEQLHIYVEKGRITEEEYQLIIKGE